MFDQHLPVPRCPVHRGFRGIQGDVGCFFTCAFQRDVSGKAEGVMFFSYICEIKQYLYNL